MIFDILAWNCANFLSFVILAWNIDFLMILTCVSGKFKQGHQQKQRATPNAMMTRNMRTKDVQTSKIAESACLTKNSGKPQPRISEWISALRIGDGEFSAPTIGSWQTNRCSNMEKLHTHTSPVTKIRADCRLSCAFLWLKLKHLLHYNDDVEEHAYVLKTNVTTWRSCPWKRDASWRSICNDENVLASHHNLMITLPVQDQMNHIRLRCNVASTDIETSL